MAGPVAHTFEEIECRRAYFYHGKNVAYDFLLCSGLKRN